MISVRSIISSNPMVIKKVGLTTGFAIAVSIALFGKLGDDPQVTRMAAIAVLMSIFWVTEAIPLAATALLPLVLLPLSGIASSKNVAAQYMNSTVFLLIGGFLIALAMQRWNLHKRIALSILVLCGGHPVSLLFGFMLATAGLSMWISNTATTLVMLPIALAILSRYGDTLNNEQAHRYGVALLLSIAYSASIGGMMTLVGTAPNLVFSRFYEMATGETVGFAQWMLLSMPVGMIMLLSLALMMKLLFLQQLPASGALKQLVQHEQHQLGKISLEEQSVLVVFIITALLWITRKSLHIADVSLLGWSEIFIFGKMMDDGSVAIAMAALLFFIPARKADGKQTRLLTEEVFSKLPWSVVLLFGGGFALAYGFAESGLSVYIASQLQGLKSAGLPLLILSVSAGMSLLTELTSNTATTQLVMPIMLSVSEVLSISPVWMMVPATLSASCAFMFPVATPPNAIIFGSGKVSVIEMVQTGVILNVIGILVVSVMSYLLLPKVLGAL